MKASEATRGWWVELAAFKERKETLVEQIDASFYERRGWRL